MQKYPKSSKVCIASVLPAPLIPVIITTSGLCFSVDSSADDEVSVAFTTLSDSDASFESAITLNLTHQ